MRTAGPPAERLRARGLSVWSPSRLSNAPLRPCALLGAVGVWAWASAGDGVVWSAGGCASTGVWQSVAMEERGEWWMQRQRAAARDSTAIRGMNGGARRMVDAAPARSG